MPGRSTVSTRWRSKPATSPATRTPSSCPASGTASIPIFVARLTDGRLFVVEYKGEHLVGAPEAREKDPIGRIWARTTGNVFVMVRNMAHGIDMTGQLRAAIEKTA